MLARIAVIGLMLSAGVAMASSTAGADGKAIYVKSCQVCHAAGVAGAPKVHNQAAWSLKEQAILSGLSGQNLTEQQKKAKVMASFIETVRKGKNAMPPGGMCPKCTDKEYEAAIVYMRMPPPKAAH